VVEGEEQRDPDVFWRELSLVTLTNDYPFDTCFITQLVNRGEFSPAYSYPRTGIATEAGCF
jgi:hypothetical protein